MEELLYNLCTVMENHFMLTQFLVEKKAELLEACFDDDIITRLLTSSLYDSFVSRYTWQNIIGEAEKQYQLHQMLGHPTSHPSIKIFKAALETFKLCFKMPMPLYTKRFLTIFDDKSVLKSMANWISFNGTDIHLLKKKGYLTCEDIKEILNIITCKDESNVETMHLQFTDGPLKDWYFSFPTMHSNGKMIELVGCHQGMGWSVNLTECIGISIGNSRSLLVRMDGGSNGFDCLFNSNFFNSHDPATFNLVTWDKFLEIAPQIRDDQPAFNHPDVVSAN